MTDETETRDHPQTIKGEGDARGSDAPAVDESGASAGGGGAGTSATSSSEQASPLGDAQSQLSEGDAEAVRRHAGGRTMGDSIGSSAGLDVGSGTPGDTGDLGGGDPQKVG